MKTVIACACVLWMLVAAAPALAANADLAVDLTDSADPVTVGTEFTYTATVTNAGPDAANGVELADTVPSQLDLVGSNPSQGSCKTAGRKLTCTLGTIAAAGSATVTIRVTAKKAGQFVDQATVSTVDTDAVTANDTDTETTTAVEPPPPPECAGQAATVTGTTGDDQLVGTAKRDVFAGLGGNDTILGLGGDDLICAAGGNDVVKGAAGNDQIRTGGGDDLLKGGDGNDGLRGGAGSDSLSGGAGADALRGGGGADSCGGGPGPDTETGC
jgi:uncharacterized repeat protein (TIGR01451 family)